MTYVNHRDTEGTEAHGEHFLAGNATIWPQHKLCEASVFSVS